MSCLYSHKGYLQAKSNEVTQLASSLQNALERIDALEKRLASSWALTAERQSSSTQQGKHPRGVTLRAGSSDGDGANLREHVTEILRDPWSLFEARLLS